MMSNCHSFFLSKVFIICVFWNLNCNMNGLRHKFSLWMCFTIILPQSIGCQCYFKCSQKQLEQKFFWFHWLTGKNKFGISCLILRKLLALHLSIIYELNWIAFMVWLTDERRLALFPAGTIVRDPHHLESPSRLEQALNLRRTWVHA